MKKPSRNTVLKAAMRVCDLWGDGDFARQSMKADIEATPNQQLPELYEHFVSTYTTYKGLSKGCLHKKDLLNA